MNRAIVLSLLALFVLATPRPANAAPATELAAPGVEPVMFVPLAFVQSAQRINGLSGYGLRHALDEIVVSPEFWEGCKALVPPQKKEFGELLRSEAELQDAPSDDFSHARSRAIAAVRVAVELQPELMEQATSTYAFEPDLVIRGIGELLQDRTIPVAMRRIARRMFRGMAAGALLVALATADPALSTELLNLYAEGMENLVCFNALTLEGEEAVEADRAIQGLDLVPPDRAALATRREQLAEASKVLASTVEHLEDTPLRLPPDRSFSS